MNRRTILRALGALVLVVSGVAIARRAMRGDPLEGERAPAFTLPIAGKEGERIRLEDQRGKVVVLDFWASWCVPCKHSVPLLNRIAKHYEKDVRVFGINSESLGPGLTAFIGSNWGIEYPILHDAAVEAQLAYGVMAFPTIMVIDRDGVVRKVYKGEPTEAGLQGQITRLIN